MHPILLIPIGVVLYFIVLLIFMTFDLDFEDLFFIGRNIFLKITKKGHHEVVQLDDTDSIDQLVLALPKKKVRRDSDRYEYHYIEVKLAANAKKNMISDSDFYVYSLFHKDGTEEQYKYATAYKIEHLVSNLRDSLFYITGTYPKKEDATNVRPIVQSYLLEDETQHTIATVLNLMKTTLPKGVTLSDDILDSSDEMVVLKKRITKVIVDLYSIVKKQERIIEHLKSQSFEKEVASFKSEIKTLNETKLDIKSVLDAKD